MKTHYPETSSIAKNLYVNRALLCVRNPIDTIVSFFNFTLTKSHDKYIEAEEFAKN